jgi:hypothetical protein
MAAMQGELALGILPRFRDGLAGGLAIGQVGEPHAETLAGLLANERDERANERAHGPLRVTKRANHASGALARLANINRYG